MTFIKYLFFVLIFTIPACAQKVQYPMVKSDSSTRIQPVSNNAAKVKNVVILIGDGMGISQITAGLYTNDNFLNLERMKYIGLHKPYCYDNLVTDSGAGATAFASGVKTFRGAVGVDKDTVTVPTIFELARDNGLATGLIVTSTVVHATPAAFFAHHSSRYSYEDIAIDLVESDIDLFIGGGRKYFNRREDDNRNLIREFKDKGYVIKDYFTSKMQKLDFTAASKFGFFTADDSPLPVYQGRKYLEGATRNGLNYLDARSKEGFVLMVEGSQIDWGGHTNNQNYVVEEMLDFDRTIGAVLDWAEADGETLVIVTSDHETGGFSILIQSQMDKLVTAFTTGQHTGDMMPVFAYGPGADAFIGIYENTELFFKMKTALGL